MRLASWRKDGAESFGLVRPDGMLVDLKQALGAAYPDLKTLLAAGALDKARGAAETAPSAGRAGEVTLLPPVPNPGRILCVGVNYPERNAEYKDGSAAPKYPSLFVRFPGSLVGHDTPIERPPESVEFDYEGEVAMIIGKAGRRIPEARALEHIGALTLMNEGTLRDWVRHGKFNVTPGKNFERSGAAGPWAVTLDETGPIDGLTLVTRVNGEETQRGHTGTLSFSFTHIIRYISTFMTLEPGDMIATGTPPGTGGRRNPPVWLKPGDVVEIECAAIGVLRNRVVDEVV
jgi:2-keto-4-pentenoate hydratase/2-oxohepta-3-ene-1,7-dioic acid hydratase in catechol pathway